MTVVSDFRAVLAGDSFRWNGPVGLQTPVIVTYSFVESVDLPTTEEYPANENNGYFTFTEAQRANFRDAAAVFSAAAGIVFVEVEDGGMIEAMNTSGSDYGGWAYFPSAGAYYTSSNYLVIDNSGDYDEGSHAFRTILHEIGHAVGLDHPHEGEFTLPPSIDTQSNTVMTYRGGFEPTSRLGVFDIQALQYLYGRAVDTSGWSIDVADGLMTLSGSTRADVIMGVLGHNDLRGKGGNDTLFGREQDDTLHGQDGADRIEGFLGNDVAFGGAGGDVLFGSLSAEEGFFGNDDDRLYGGAGSDRMLGQSGSDQLFGGDGDDRIFGGSEVGGYENDLLRGGDGADTLAGRWGDDDIAGGNGADTLFGDDGADRLTGGEGSDRLTGGDGSDTFVFSKADMGRHSDRVVDFDGVFDRLDLTATRFDYGDVVLTRIDGGRALLVTIGGSGGIDIELVGIQRIDISPDDFLF